jgi:hypothetical protein
MKEISKSCLSITDRNLDPPVKICQQMITVIGREAKFNSLFSMGDAVECQIIFIRQLMKYLYVVQKLFNKFQRRLDMLWLDDQGIAAKEYSILIASDKIFVGYRLLFHKRSERG